VLVGETCYEGHMQQGFGDVQRRVFWGNMLSGAAGHTYGAAGIPGEVRFIYRPRRGIYDWRGALVKKLEPSVTYHVFYFDPATGRRFDQGTVMYAGPTPPPFKGHTEPLLFEDAFDNADAASWKDYGTPTRRGNSRLVGGKGMVTVAEEISEPDLMASAEAGSDAEAGIILRFHDADNCVVGLYSPHFKTLFIHDRKHGEWGANLGEVPVPEVGPKIQITAAVCGKYAACVLTDGKKTYWTPIVEVGNTAAGRAGLWLYQIGDRQEFDNFALSGTRFAPVEREGPSGAMGADTTLLYSDEYAAPSLPSPQDWVLVMERLKP